MRHQTIPILALCALCGFLSGCGCSKESKPSDGDGLPPRMRDAAYTNKLVSLHGSRSAIAARAANIRARIAKLGDDARGSAEYADLTNQLAQCEAETAKVKREAISTIRARILKEKADAKKGDLKK